MLALNLGEKPWGLVLAQQLAKRFKPVELYVSTTLNCTKCRTVGEKVRKRRRSVGVVVTVKRAGASQALKKLERGHVKSKMVEGLRSQIDQYLL